MFSIFFLCYIIKWQKKELQELQKELQGVPIKEDIGGGINGKELMSHLMNLNRKIVMICNHIPELIHPGTYDEFMDAKAANKVLPGLAAFFRWNGSTCISLDDSMGLIIEA